MKFDQKTYNYSKIKSLLQSNDFIYIYNSINYNSINWLKVEQHFHLLNIKYCKINTVLGTKAIDNSIFKNYFYLFQGPHMLAFPNENRTPSSIKPEDNNKKFTLLGIKLKKKIYCNTKLNTLISYKFSKNMSYLNKFIERFIKNLILFKFLSFKRTLFSK